MPLQKLPTIALDDPNYRRRARETINNILDHSFDDSKVRTPAEVAADVVPINKAYSELHAFRYMSDEQIADVRAGTGSVDVTSALQSAIDVAGALDYRGMVYCPRGLYSHSGLTFSVQGVGFSGAGRRETVLHYTGSGHGIDVTSGAHNVRLADLQVHGSAAAQSLVRWTDAANGSQQRVHYSPNGGAADCVILQKASFYHLIDDCMIDAGGTGARGLLMQANGAVSGPNSSTIRNLRVLQVTTAIDIVDGNNLIFDAPRLETDITTGFNIGANVRDVQINSPRFDWDVPGSKGINAQAGAQRIVVINPRNDISGAGSTLLSNATSGEVLMIEGSRFHGLPLFLNGAFITDVTSNNPYLDFGTNAGTQRGLIQVTGSIFDFFAASGFGMRFRVHGGNVFIEADTSSNVTVGKGTLATNATDGFLYVPTCAGPPTGVPTAKAGFVPIVVDVTNNKLYFRSNGAWRDAGP